MPQPHPGQEWKHGWIPLTAGAAQKKNHGRKPGAGSLLSRMVKEAAEVHNRMKERDAQRSRTSDGRPSTPAAKPAKTKSATAPTAEVRNRSDRETSRQVDAAIRQATGRPTGEQNNRAPSLDEIETQARSAYDQLAREPGDWVSVSKLREKLGKDMPRAEVDKVLLRMAGRRDGVYFAPEANQKTLTDADRSGALVVAGVPKHMMAIQAW